MNVINVNEVENYSLELIQAAINEAKAEIVTLALRRVNNGGMARTSSYNGPTIGNKTLVSFVSLDNLCFIVNELFKV